MASYRVISSDSHVFEPPDLWTSRMEPRFRDRAPRIARWEGEDAWVCDGHRLIGTSGGGAQAGLRFEAPEQMRRTHLFEDVRPGGYIPDEHVKDMDLDGIGVGILYPSAGDNAYRVEDTKLLNDICSTYNDWIAEFCNSYPDRLKGVGMINLDDGECGVKELERCANIGLVGAIIPVYPPEDRWYSSSEYESLWAASQDLEMPLSLHVVTNRSSKGHDYEALVDNDPVFGVNIDHWVRTSLGQLIFTGVFQRYPRLQVGAVEHEVSWACYFLRMMDYVYTQRPHRHDWYRSEDGMLPSDYFHRNVFVSFQEDELAIRNRDIIGVDNLLWGSDYPHEESTFPRSREILEEILSNCDEEEKAKISGINAARVYNLD